MLNSVLSFIAENRGIEDPHESDQLIEAAGDVLGPNKI